MSKTITEINRKIEDKTVRVVRADEMTRIVSNVGAEKAAETVDVVTTGTFGAMCSSGVFLNFGHFYPPIRMATISLNSVEAYGGLAAVDAYLGATQPSVDQGVQYGGAHVIEDLIRGQEVVLKATSPGTDCYPRKKLLTRISLDDLNHAVLCNPRNAYQRYNAAVNSSSEPKYTYMGKLLPDFGNITFSGAGELSPLMNDPEFRTIGVGTRIFLGGGQGYVMGNGTQHDPENGFSTLMVTGDLKKMSPDFLRAASFSHYGCSLYVGIGVPIPILDVDMAIRTSIGDGDIFTALLDYGHSEKGKPVLGKVSYGELKSGIVTIKGRRVKSSCLSSYSRAVEIAETLKKWISQARFFLSDPVENISKRGDFKTVSRKYLRGIGRISRPGFKDSGESIPFWDRKTCIHCGLCVSVCPRGVFSFNHSGRIRTDEKQCNRCGLCSDICPVKAIHHDSKIQQTH